MPRAAESDLTFIYYLPKNPKRIRNINPYTTLIRMGVLKQLLAMSAGMRGGSLGEGGGILSQLRGAGPMRVNWGNCAPQCTTS